VLERRLADGELKLRDAVLELDAALVELPAETLANVNTPRELVPYATRDVRVVRHPGATAERDLVAVEEPLELRIGGESVAVTMRTPGHDEELALGFAIGEGLDPISAELAADLAGNAVELAVRNWDADALRRNFYTTSSCGVCGKGALSAIAVLARRVESPLVVEASLLASLPDRLLEAQRAFELTGGLHAAAVFGRAGAVRCVREDVGRHNALDKAVGWAFRRGLLPLADKLLCVSGRLSFELVQKAALAGCPVLVGVGAPSSLALELAEGQGVTLCGWARRGGISVYSNAARVR
jgi:FdhD protein